MKKRCFSLRKWVQRISVFALTVLIATLNPPTLFSQEPAYFINDIRQLSSVAATFCKEDAFSFVEELTQDEYTGRNSGTDGCVKAGNWIADQFKTWGLHPYKDGSYLQSFNSPMALEKTNNVIGYIPSINKNIEASIVIGAHYDHIGQDRSGNIFHGANDNASGTGSMMEMAHTLATSNLISHVNIVFIAFSAEEKGLVGSYYYVNHPLFPIEKTIAMINLDMVGTGIGPWEIATNFDKNKELNQVLTDVFKYYKVPYRLASWYLKPVSDHYPFFVKGVPVLFFIRANPSNIGGYHTLKDTINTIDPKNLDECGKAAVLVTLLLTKDMIYIVPRYEHIRSGTCYFDFVSSPRNQVVYN